MLLAARLLNDVNGVNSFDFVTAYEVATGDAFDVYFQFYNAGRGRGSSPEAPRYMPAAGATVSVTVLNLDSAKQFVRVAAQPFAQDPSIWRFSILSTDPVTGTVSLKVALTEAGATRTVQLQGALRVDSVLEVC